MIISHYHKFVFVKTNKTAGSSLEALITRHLQPGDMITRRNDMDVVKEIAGKGIEILNSKGSPYRRDFMNHSPLSDAHQIFPETKKYFSFGIIRNPFSRCVSSFRWRNQKRIESILGGKHPQKENISIAEKKLQDLFETYTREGKGRLNQRGRDLLQSCDPNSGLCWSVSQIVQLEKINILNYTLKRETGLEIDVNEMPKLKSNVIKIPESINIMTEKAIDSIQVNHEWEINTFGYNP